MKKTDVTAVINAHREGLMVASTLESVAKAVKVAHGQGISVEVIAIADRPDDVTLKVLESFDRLPIDIRVADNGDLAESRNEAVRHGNGDFVAFIDGDDLWGPEWIVRAVNAARTETRECVWHPEVNLYFSDTTQWLFHHPDMDAEDFDVWRQLVTNCWTALSFARRSVYLRHPYVRNEISKGTGYEDWSWNCTTIAQGIIHKTVPDTCHFIRKKSFSMVQETNTNEALVSRHDLYSYLSARGVRKAEPGAALAS